MNGFWEHLWERRRRLITIWFVVMVLVLIRLFTMPLVFTSACVLMPLPMEQVEQGSGGGFGGASVRSLLAGGGSLFAVAVVIGQVIDRIDSRIAGKSRYQAQCNDM